jgi:CubicO group peptidase (beta-lactamase class C family)
MISEKRRWRVMFAGASAAGLALVVETVLLSQPSVDLSSLDHVVADELKASNIPGAAVAIVQGDKIVFAKGFGVANVETGTPVTPDTLFQIGSMTKTFTAAAVLPLADEGVLKIDRPIGEYVKGLSP